MTSRDAKCEELLERAQQGDRAAIDDLFALHRKRIRQMVAVRMDHRLVARCDPSDVVQEALVDASKRLPQYLRERPLPFYPWLRQIAWERLVDLHRRHLYSYKRRVTREQEWALPLPGKSALDLARQLAARDTGALERMLRKELRERVQTALEALSAADREVLVLKHLEHLRLDEIAAILQVSPAAVQSRYRRAVERLHRQLRELAEDQ